MALLALLEIGDNLAKRYNKQYLLTDLRLLFNRSYNVIPNGNIRCERMEMFVVAPGKDDLFMFEWFLHKTTISGRIVVSLTGDLNDMEPRTQEIYFEDARCFSLTEKYSVDNSSRRLLKLSMASEKIKMDEVTFNCI